MAPVSNPWLTDRPELLAGGGLTVAALLYLWGRKAAGEEERVPGNGILPEPLVQLPKGRVFCPGDVIGKTYADLAGLKPGDFVIVTLSNRAGNLRESTWARVLGVGERLAVQLVSSQQAGVPALEATVQPIKLHTKWHGFVNGQRLFISPTCVWDVIHTHEEPGTLLCGSRGAAAMGHSPVGVRILGPKDRVLILLGNPKGVYLESVWAAIENLSYTGSVVKAKIVDYPKHTDKHGFKHHSVVEFTRDCVFDAKRL